MSFVFKKMGKMRFLLIFATASALIACAGDNGSSTSGATSPGLFPFFEHPDEVAPSNPSWKNEDASNYPKAYDSENPQPNSLNNP